MAKLTERELLTIVEGEFSSAMGTYGGDIAVERSSAWDFYESKLLGNEIEGMSQVVTSDVSDVVDGIMPSLLRIFTTAENLVSFDPVGPDDQEKAEQESDFVNYTFFKKNPAFEILHTWFFDALVQKNGIVKTWWDESETATYESYQGLSESELAGLLDDPELEPLERAEREMETVDPSGEALVVGVVHDVMFRRVAKVGRVRVACVPPEEYRISSDTRGLDPGEARMVGQERQIKRSDLLGMGFDKQIVDDLPADSNVLKSEEEISRRDRSDDDNHGSRDRSQDQILVKEAYIKVDFDGDGRSELRQVFVAGGRILSNEPADRQPFHVICPHPMPHKHFGRATAEKAMDIQLVNSTLLRQTLDNLYHTNNPSHGVYEMAIGENTLDDLLSTRVGSVKRFARPMGEAYAPITVPFTAGSTFPMLEYFDKVKRDRTGISSDSQGLNIESLKNIQTSALAQAVDISRMKIEAIARIFSETGIKSLFLHIHELLLKHQQKAQIVKLRNKWVEVNPQEWRTRLDMTVHIGLGIGNREQNLLHLSAIWEKQMAMVQGGGMNLTVTPRNIFNTAAELVKNANLKQPEMFFTDPGDALAPPPSDEQQEFEKLQAELEQRQQQLDGERQQIAMAKLQLEAEKMQINNEREQFKMMLDHEQKMAKLAIMQESAEDRDVDIALKQAEIMLKRAQAAKAAADAEAQDIENDAVQSGIVGLIGG
jgi:hypothetical protein